MWVWESVPSVVHFASGCSHWEPKIQFTGYFHWMFTYTLFICMAHTYLYLLILTYFPISQCQHRPRESFVLNWCEFESWDACPVSVTFKTDTLKILISIKSLSGWTVFLSLMLFSTYWLFTFNWQRTQLCWCEVTHGEEYILGILLPPQPLGKDRFLGFQTLCQDKLRLISWDFPLRVH